MVGKVMLKRTPYRVDTYCGGCADTKAHYFREDLSDDKRDCFECVKCMHLIYAPRGECMGRGWYEGRKNARKGKPNGNTAPKA